MNISDYIIFRALLGIDEDIPNKDEYKEIKRLHQMLENENIPHDFVQRLGGYQIVYFGHHERPVSEGNIVYGSADGSVCDVIQNPMSYGLELSGLLTEEELANDSVAGYLTPDDIFERIRKDWNCEN